MIHNPELHDKLIDNLQDMYAVENHLVETLGKQIKKTSDMPMFQEKIQIHEECLQRYGKKPTGVKSALTNLMGTLSGSLSGVRSETLARYARNNYVAEHFEIACYEMLIAMAMAYGDQQTVQACQLNLHDEVITAKWLESHIGQAMLMSLQDDGIAISAADVKLEQNQLNATMTDLWQEAYQQASIS